MKILLCHYNLAVICDRVAVEQITPISSVPVRTWTTLKEGWGWGSKALRPQGLQHAATPFSGKICSAVPRLERHSRCLSRRVLQNKERKREEGVEKKRLGC